MKAVKPHGFGLRDDSVKVCFVFGQLVLAPIFLAVFLVRGVKQCSFVIS